MNKTKYNRYSVYNNAVKNVKMFKLGFTNYELLCIANALQFNIQYSKMYKFIAKNLYYNFSNFLSPIVLNSYQVDGLKDCIENYLKKFKIGDNVEKTLIKIKNNLINIIESSNGI